MSARSFCTKRAVCNIFFPSNKLQLFAPMRIIIRARLKRTNVGVFLSHQHQHQVYKITISNETRRRNHPLRCGLCIALVVDRGPPRAAPSPCSIAHRPLRESTAVPCRAALAVAAAGSSAPHPSPRCARETQWQSGRQLGRPLRSPAGGDPQSSLFPAHHASGRRSTERTRQLPPRTLTLPLRVEAGPAAPLLLRRASTAFAAAVVPRARAPGAVRSRSPPW